MHLHVNPFQIVELPKNITTGTSYTSWFEASNGWWWLQRARHAHCLPVGMGAAADPMPY